MINTLLTVIIPVYNGEKFIARALECLTNQTFQNFNIEIINDGSLDKTKNIVETFMEKYKNISLTNLSENRGVSYCRTLGIKTCKTPFITFLDSDDWIDITTYENCINSIRDDIDIVVYGLSYEYLDIDVSERKYFYDRNFVISGSYALKIYGHTIKDSFKITPIINNKIYRTDFLIHNKIFFNEEIRYQEDDIFTFDALMHARNVAFVSNCQYHYYQNSDSVIHHVSDISVIHFAQAYGSLKLKLEQDGLFNKYKNEFYLKCKSSLKGVVTRVVHYCTDVMEVRRLLALLHEKFVQVVDLKDFLAYFNLQDL